MKKHTQLQESEHVTGNIPNWLREKIKSERLICSMASLSDPFGYHVGEAEILACLMINARKGNLDEIQKEVYLYLAAKLLKKQGQRLDAYMFDKLKWGMTAEEKQELKELRKEIYLKGGLDILYPANAFINRFRKKKGEEDLCI